MLARREGNSKLLTRNDYRKELFFLSGFWYITCQALRKKIDVIVILKNTCRENKTQNGDLSEKKVGEWFFFKLSLNVPYQDKNSFEKIYPIKQIGPHACKRDMMGQSYPIYVYPHLCIPPFMGVRLPTGIWLWGLSPGQGFWLYAWSLG